MAIFLRKCRQFLFIFRFQIERLKSRRNKILQRLAECLVKQSLTNGDSLFNYFKKNEPFFHKAKKELLDESENKKVIYFTFRTLHFIDWFAPIDLALNKYFPNKYNIFYIDFATTLHRIGNGFEYLYFCQQVQQRLISFEISPLNHFSYYLSLIHI